MEHNRKMKELFERVHAAESDVQDATLKAYHAIDFQNELQQKLNELKPHMEKLQKTVASKELKMAKLEK